MSYPEPRLPFLFNIRICKLLPVWNDFLTTCFSFGQDINRGHKKQINDYFAMVSKNALLARNSFLRIACRSLENTRGERQ